MSSVGHVLDMLRRDKENRELRKNFSKRNSIKDQCVLKSEKSINYISLEEMEDIKEKVDSKNRTDEMAMGKEVIMMLLGCAVVVAVSFCILYVIGWF